MYKVCHISSSHSQKDPRIFNRECITLSEAGYDVTLIVPGGVSDSNVINIIGVDKPKSRLDRMLKITNRIYKKALSVDADIYHFHDPDLLLFGLCLKRRGKKVIFDSHENYTELIKTKEYIPEFLRKIISRIYFAFETYICGKIDGVVGVSEKENGPSLFDGRSKQSAYVGNYPKLNEITKTIIDNTLDKGISYVGLISNNRGIEQTMDACHELGIRFILGGVDVEGSGYIDYLKKKESWNIVDYRGWADSDEKSKIYSESFAGVFLINVSNGSQMIESDNLPTKVYEYMASRIPAIVTKYPYSEKIVNKHEFGMCVNPDDYDMVKNTIKYLYENREQCNQMGIKGRKIVEDKYNWDLEKTKLLELYERILNV